MNDDEPFTGWRERLVRERASIAVGMTVALLLCAFTIGILFHPWSPKNVYSASATNTISYPLRVSLPRTVVIALDELEELAESDASLAVVVEQQKEALAKQADQDSGSVPGNSAQFATAFGELDTSASGKPAPQANASGFLEVDYDLATLEPAAETYNRSDGSLTVEKPLYVDGKSSGAATIRIEEGAQILIATSSVARALGDRASALPRRITGALATGTGFIPFYELRGAGVEVAYDPVNDRVSLSLPT